MQEKGLEITPEMAEALLEYIAMEDCRTKNIITVLAKSQIKHYLRYVDLYAKATNISQEEALQKIIEQRS